MSLQIRQTLSSLGSNLATPLFENASTPKVRQPPSSSFHQNGYKMKAMNFPDWLGQRRRHSRSYGHDEPQRQAGKGTFLCKCFGETDYQGGEWCCCKPPSPPSSFFRTDGVEKGGEIGGYKSNGNKNSLTNQPTNQPTNQDQIHTPELKAASTAATRAA